MSTTKAIIGFFAGLGIGAGGAYLLTARKYTKMLDEETAKTFEYKNKPAESAEAEEETKVAKEPVEVVAEAPVSSPTVEVPTVPTRSTVADTTVIPYSEYAELEGYDCKTLYYFQNFDVIQDATSHQTMIHPECVIGDEALNSFGMNEEDEDVVTVINYENKTYYEIIRKYGTPWNT